MTFTFTMDAFPDYTRFDPTKKVLASIQIIEENEGFDPDSKRQKTHAGETTASGASEEDLGV